jgi:hypothetical protein
MDRIHKTIENYMLERMWKETVIACFEILSQYNPKYLEIHRTCIKNREWSPDSHLNSEHSEYQPSEPAAMDDDWNDGSL